MSETLEAKLAVYVFCPGCGNVQTLGLENDLLRCDATGCEYRSKSFKRPTVKLEPVEE
jgi:hypothetical protein